MEPGLMDTLVDLHDGEIAYMDSIVGGFLEWLDQRICPRASRQSSSSWATTG
jgi:hypothetical protein